MVFQSTVHVSPSVLVYATTFCSSISSCVFARASVVPLARGKHTEDENLSTT